MPSWKRLAIRRQVIVNLKTGNAIKGILWDQRGGLLILKQALFLTPGGEPSKVDGEALVQVTDIEFTQVLPEG